MPMTETSLASENPNAAFAVKDTFAEAFPMTGTRLIVTADSPAWAAIAGQTMTGYATSVIACDAEAGIERVLDADQDPRRPAGSESARLCVQPRCAREGASPIGLASA